MMTDDIEYDIPSFYVGNDELRRLRILFDDSYSLEEGKNNG